MRSALSLVFVVLFSIAALGCQEQPGEDQQEQRDQQRDAAGSGEQSQQPEQQKPSDVAGYQPEYTLSIEASDADPPQYTVSWTALVNTGGWEMTRDDVKVETVGGERVARIYITLDQPGPDEMVTQALETLKGTEDAGAEPIDRAELHVKRTQAGEPIGDSREHRLVAETTN